MLARLPVASAEAIVAPGKCRPAIGERPAEGEEPGDPPLGPDPTSSELAAPAASAEAWPPEDEAVGDGTWECIEQKSLHFESCSVSCASKNSVGSNSSMEDSVSETPA